MRLIDADALKTHKFLSPQYKVLGGRRNGKVKEQIVEAYQKGWNDCIDAIIDNAPTVEAVEFEYHSKLIKQAYQKGKDIRPQGEWIVEEDAGLIGCSCCHIVWLRGFRGFSNFCPNCGADMRGGRE